MSTEYKYDLIVIGGGPGGYSGAIRAAQQGLKTALVERDRIGGCCLNVGCIPTKTLFSSAEHAESAEEAGKFGLDVCYSGVRFADVIKRKDGVVKKLTGGVAYLLQSNGVDVYADSAMVESAHSVRLVGTGETLTTANILIATGSANAKPPITGLDLAGILDSTDLLSLKELPESLIIIGGGVIGCEFAGIFRAFGTKVTVIEMLPALLGNMDPTLAEYAARELKKQGVKIFCEAAVKAVEQTDNGMCRVTYEKAGATGFAESSYVLVSTGRKANIEGLFAPEVAPETNHGYLCVDDHMRTSIEGIYAVGDITGQGMLAHTAYAGAETAVANILGRDQAADFRVVPKVVFISEEIASVGYNKAEAAEAGIDAASGTFHLGGNGKALAMGCEKGFITVTADVKTHRIVGVHMACRGASELIAVATQIMEAGLTTEQVEATIYPHPSVSEALKEAASAVFGRPLHA